MQLHLVVPGLIWPRRIHTEATRDLDLQALPALGWLLGHGQAAWQAGLSLEDGLAGAFAATDTRPAQAALRYLGEDPEFRCADIDQHDWLCADPVHLALEKRRLTLHHQANPATAVELQEIARAIQPILIEYRASLGELRFIPGQRPGLAYLQLSRPAGLNSQPPSMASGTDSLLLQGEQERPWRQLQNEIQMLLHTLPLNAQREARGQPALNSLWLWGAGPRLAAAPARAGRYTAVHGQHPLLPGLARWAGCSSDSNIALADALTAATDPQASLLWLESSLAGSHRDYDLLNWQNQLIQLEGACFQPLQVALQKGCLQSLRISAPGREISLEMKINRWSRHCFWHRPQALATLLPEPAGSA